METFKKEKCSAASRRPFSGQGHVLGNPTPPIVGAPHEEDRTVNEANARRLLQLNPNEPVTK